MRISIREFSFRSRAAFYAAGVLLAAALQSSAARGASPPVDGVPPHLTLADAEALFLERGLDLLIAEQSVEGAQGDLRAAGAHPNPGVDLGVLYTPAWKRDVLYSGVNTQALWGLNLGLSDNAALSDQLSGKRSLRIEAATKALAAARLNVGEVKRLGLAALRQAYVVAVMAELNLTAAKDSFETFDQQLKLNQKRYDEGAISGLDLSRVTQAQLEAQQAVDQAETGRKQALASLLVLLGVRGKLPEVTLDSGIEYDVLPKMKEATFEWLQSQAAGNRTDAKLAATALEQAEVAVRQARRARVPDVALSLGYGEQCSGSSCSSEPAFSAGLQGNVPLLYQQQGEIARAEANAHVAQRNVEKVQALILSDVTQAFAAYVGAKAQVERMEAKLLDQAKVSRDLAQHMYQRGAASFIDFMDAQRAYVASRLEYHQDLANFWNAVYGLEEATATPLR